ncbi:zinc/iron transporter protein [Pseudovirgaria hyperparasitica]|uniref:Zinc/iron transporter protein n=1 Tax=Pseudovirgaria hyperparasitica TaxID=470096 RepID=A0A6A6VS50_9PEZI|nr:zinc/iron transporter protein [Pseudovirgaria hyperparasitica]KAF2753422.1 zinc/iron transporter protein [Pseudovirgaria hyperparasitica]
MLHNSRLLLRGFVAAWLGCAVCAQTEAPASSTTAPEIPTAVSSCHAHGATQYCEAGTEEYPILMEATPTGELPSEYTGCHAHGSDAFCFAPDGSEVQLVIETSGAEEPADEHSHGGEEEGNGCHFHAGVEHCPGQEEVSCERTDRDYNVPLRIGLLFVILVTSGIGVFLPIAIAKFNLPFQQGSLMVVKQFGTGVIISTAFIHLFTHAQLMFANQCLGELSYEGTTAAIVMAGIIVSFLIDYLSHRVVYWRRSQASDRDSEAPSTNDGSDTAAKSSVTRPDTSTALAPSHGHGHATPGEWQTDTLTVASLEAGILFHSILIGLTLVVAGDSGFITLFIVIVFHQMFEGLALGSMIAQVPSGLLATWKKCVMGLAFTVITPIGMAIGIGVLNHFNGNDRSTIVAIGTLDAFSAGILVWVGVVEMLAKDWMEGPLLNAGVVRTLLAGTSLVAGLVVMSVLGKWA